MGAILTHGVFLFLSYWITSIIEWGFHQFGMHSSKPSSIPTKAFQEVCKRHIAHHSLTRFDMTLKTPQMQKKADSVKKEPKKTTSGILAYLNQFYPLFDENETKSVKQKYGDENYGNFGRFQGIFFLWPATFPIAIAFYSINFILNLCMKSIFLSLGMEYSLSLFMAMVYATIYCLWMNGVWNYIHAEIHHVGGLTLDKGLDVIPKHDWIKSTALYRLLWKNHVLHHLCLGDNAGNYNVTFLGADWLFGTYRTQCKRYKVDEKKQIITKLEQ